ncbi:hypothetical protein BRADI_2g08657v3 [Brachypodium distachyon]|uniref:Uncharacterized protein n=1 Tax=Brachypodium distachyon TaxID=15368 RepID=A0A2K2D7K0_BRADI|nr:hypothetical protein BRADI_2g08657v3 [Brachypodium distachyon]
MHCNMEVRSPICRSPGVNMMITLKRRSSEALRKDPTKVPTLIYWIKHLNLEQTPCLQDQQHIKMMCQQQLLNCNEGCEDLRLKDLVLQKMLNLSLVVRNADRQWF